MTKSDAIERLNRDLAEGRLFVPRRSGVATFDDALKRLYPDHAVDAMNYSSVGRVIKHFGPGLPWDRQFGARVLGRLARVKLCVALAAVRPLRISHPGSAYAPNSHPVVRRFGDPLEWPLWSRLLANTFNAETRRELVRMGLICRYRPKSSAAATYVATLNGRAHFATVICCPACNKPAGSIVEGEGTDWLVGCRSCGAMFDKEQWFKEWQRKW